MRVYAHMLIIGEGEGIAMNQRLDDFLPAGFQKPLYCAARHPHDNGGFLLLAPFAVTKTHRLQLIETQLPNGQLGQRDARGLV